MRCSAICVAIYQCLLRSATYRHLVVCCVSVGCLFLAIPVGSYTKRAESMNIGCGLVMVINPEFGAGD